jgi:hypothetical protein|tara:strand:- start:1787 stop:2035 length:249 start_codon:yes stop_codon:yes gene_type:complete
MSGKIGKYTYKNESVLNEFLSSLMKALAGRKRTQILKQLHKDPEMKKIMAKIEKNQKDVMAKAEKERKTNPDLDKALKLAGI